MTESQKVIFICFILMMQKNISLDHAEKGTAIFLKNL